MAHRKLGRATMKPRLLAAVGCAAVLLALSVEPAAAAPPGDAGISVRTEQAAATRADDFRSCIAGGGPTDVLLLVDESSSLQGSDPENARVTSAGYLITQLAQFATRSEADLSVGVAVFAQGYSRLEPWRPLNNSTLSQVQTSIDSLKDRVHGMETDYWSALDGGRADLAAQAAARPGKTSCQAIVWFTDGALNYTIRGNDEDKEAFGATKPFAPQLELTSEASVEEARRLSMSSMCREGGLADQLRSSKVALFGIGLSAGNAATADYSFLESVTTGKSSPESGTCGKYVSPVPGEFYLASDIDGMLMAFDGISSTGSSPIVQEQGICQVSRCIDSAHRFVLDQSTPEVRLLATADAGGLSASIMSPSGQVLELPKSVGTESALTPDGNALKYTWLSDKSVVVSLATSSEGKSWSGLWQLAYTDPTGQSSAKKSHTNIHITGGLKPVWTNQNGMKLHAGDKVPGLLFGLEGPAGTAVNPASLLGEAKLTASVQSSQGKKVVVADGIGKGDFVKPLTLDLTDFPVGAAELRLELSVTTASTTANGAVVPGTELAPSAVTVPLSLIPPSDFPVLAAKVDFGKLEGEPQAVGALDVSGQGCVWIASDAQPEVAASPEQAGKISVALGSATGPQNCLHVKDATSLPVTFSAESQDNGSVVGRFTVMTAPENEPEKALPVSVEFTASLSKPLNSTNFLLVLIVALILGPGIPLLLLYGAKWLVSSIPGRALSSELIAITVKDRQLLRDGQPFSLRPTDLTNLVPMSPSGSRSVSASGIELKAKTGWSPFGAGFVSVVAPGRIGVGSGYPGADHSGLKPLLPLAVHNKWVLLRDADGDANSAHVLVLASGDSTSSEAARIGEDIRNRLPGLWERLLEASPLPVHAGRGSAPASPFGGPSDDDLPSGGFTGFGSAGSFTTTPDTGASEFAPTPVRPPDQGGTSPWGTPRS